MYIPSKFAHFSETPKSALNWRLAFAVVGMGLLGASRGIDEGLIGGIITQKTFEKTFGIPAKSNKESNVTAMVQLFSVLGAILGYPICERLGRVRGAQIACVLVLLGSALWAGSNGHYAMLLVARAIAGVGVGLTPIVAPIFLVEIAPKQIRGLCTSVYSFNVYLGLLLSYCVDLGSKSHINAKTNAIWQVPLSLNFSLHVVVLCFLFFLKESPRWLMMKDRTEEASAALGWYRGMEPRDKAFVEEYELIADSVKQEREATEGLGFMGKVRELFGSNNNQFKLVFCVLIQILGQWQGPGALSTYANRILTLIGVHDTRGYVMSAGFGAVKLGAGILSSFFLIDLFGRRRTLWVSTLFQGLAMLYVAIYLGVFIDHKHAANKSASEAALASIFIAGASWSAGGNLAQYLINSEIFSLDVRALSASFVMAFHFLMQYSATRALQPMLNSGLKGAGTFAIFSAMSLLVALPVYLFFLPETSGQSLERIDELFDLPWYKIGRASRRPVRDEMPQHSMPAALESQWQRDGAPVSSGVEDKDKDKYENFAAGATAYGVRDAK
ncbi:related to Quinate permease [Sporisorium reilianum f. sp. reilianum]|uniref:Related to Quinate permease n=1 Tax=Sporisorium reilianum f. sp. reilianum TaxID=72559 RepID=A0A2N8UCD2_9BASI|nr:related to Quinate permease [Sporisorium reilianum f. sp. reilianum]